MLRHDFGMHALCAARHGHQPRPWEICARLGCTVLLALVALLVGACSAVPTARNQADARLDRVASQLADRLEASRLNLTESGAPDPSAIALARVASGPDGNPAVLEAKGNVFHGGAVLVVRVSISYADFGGSSVPLTKCFRYRVTESWYQVERSATRCPHGPPVSLPPTSTTRPDLGNLIDDIQRSINTLTSAERQDLTTVKQAVEHATTGQGAVVTADTREGVIGIAIARQIDCVLARVAKTTEVWRPASVDPAYGRPGEISCHPGDAIARTQQQPPH
jgi:hypothetical protein